MTHTLFIVALALCIFVNSRTATAQTLDALFDTKEAIVANVASKLLDLATNQKCTYNCSACSYEDCISSIDNKQCVTNRGSLSQCGGCIGRSISTANSVVSYPPGTDLNNLPDDFKTIECWSQGLEPTFKAALQTDSKLTWTYFASATGFLRLYPGIANPVCGYDPRDKPWYISAISGPKDVIIVIDASGSMTQGGRDELAKQAAISVLRTLVISDYFGVLYFNSNAAYLGGRSLLVPASKANVDAAVADIEGGISWIGNTNYEAAFTFAFNMLNNSIGLESTTGCATGRAILFLTDGDITVGKSGEALYSYINTLNAPYKATIFTYGLGDQATSPTASSVLKRIACDNEGVWTPITDQSRGLIVEMSQYYQYFAALNAGHEQIMWIEPYEDDSGAGNLVTASQAIYDKSVTPPLLLGIVAADLKTEEMFAVQPNYATFLQYLTKKARYCPPTKFDFCKLETLRTTDYSNSGINVTQRACNASAVIQNCSRQDPPSFACNPARRKPFCNTASGYSYPREGCCSDCAAAQGPANIAVAVGAGVGVPLGVIIIAVVVFLLVSKGACAGGASGGGGGGGGGGSSGGTATAASGNASGKATADDGHDSWSS